MVGVFVSDTYSFLDLSFEPGGGGIPYNGLDVEAPPEMVTLSGLRYFFRHLHMNYDDYYV